MIQLIYKDVDITENVSINRFTQVSVTPTLQAVRVIRFSFV